MKIKLLLLACLPLVLMAQEDESIKVMSFTSEMTDLSASTHMRLDGNGEPTALVKVQILSEDDVDFSSNMLVNKDDIQIVDKHYWVYLAQGAKYLTIIDSRFPQLKVVFEEASNGEIKTLEGKSTYRLVISVPEPQQLTYQQQLDNARQMMAEASQHSETDYFRKMVVQYEATMKHIDCPPSDLSILQTEYDKARYMRKYTYLYEKMSNKADECSGIYGTTSDSTYKYLQLAYKSTKKLTEKYPTIAFEKLSSLALRRLQSHPKGKEVVTSTQTVQRRTAQGTVSLKTNIMPLNAIGIYAAKEQNPKAKDKKILGKVHLDGTFNVVIPDGYDYIILDGESKGHAVWQQTNTLNIVIK